MSESRPCHEPPSHPEHSGNDDSDSRESHQDLEEQSASKPQQVTTETVLTHNIAPAKTQHHMITRAKSGIFKPKIYAADIQTEEPETYDQAIKNEKWKAATQEEYNALIKNKT